MQQKIHLKLRQKSFIQKNTPRKVLRINQKYGFLRPFPRFFYVIFLSFWHALLRSGSECYIYRLPYYVL